MNTDQNFSMIHFLSLLEKKENQGLSDSERKELSTYLGLVSSQMNYDERLQYLSLFQDFVDGQKDLERVFTELTSFYYKDLHASKMLVSNREKLANVKIEFEIASKMNKFSDLIFDLWERLENEYENEANLAVYDSNYSLDVDKYSNYIRETYQQIQKLLE
jgi:protein-tyrosine phosphatase